MEPKSKYWFPAKRYGWGWGLPISWQGWMVTCAYFVFLVLGSFVFLPNKQTILYIIFMTMITTVQITVCWLKGEPISWRGGQRR